jgi:signal transduction histidine kinase
MRWPSTDHTTGVGLGLALSRGLTEAIRGTLEPEETPDGQSRGCHVAWAKEAGA